MLIGTCHHPIPRPTYLYISGSGDLDTATDSWKMYSVLWAIISVLTVSYMIIRLIKNPHQEPQQQGNMFNNMVHNPALVSNLQILLVIFMFVLVYMNLRFMSTNGPNGFILALLPGVVMTFLVYPLLIYAFNQNLRKFVVREVLGIIPNQIQDVQSNSQVTRF